VSRSGRAAVAAVLGCVGLVFAWPADGATPGCEVGLESRDSWHGVVAPAGTSMLAQDDVETCIEYAAVPAGLQRSRDGGRSWNLVHPGPVTALWTESLGHGAVLISTASGLLRSTDFGGTWQAAAGLPPTGPITSASRLGTDVVVSTGAASPQPSLYASHDAGATFIPLPVSGALGATRVTVAGAGPAGRPVVWAGGPGGLHVSLDGGATFLPRGGGDAVFDVHGGTALDGSRVMIAATNTGLLSSADDGLTITSIEPTTTYHAVRLETGRPDVALALGPDAERFSNSGLRVQRKLAGYPPTCTDPVLSRASDEPGSYLAGCAEHTWWRFRSSGVDLAVLPPPSSTTPVPLPVIPGSGALTVLARHRLSAGIGTSDGSLAFDGTDLYWTDTGEVTIHRMRASTGGTLPDLNADDLPASPTGLSYDPVRDVLYATTSQGVFSVDHHTAKVRKMFGKVRLAATGTAFADAVFYSYDYRIDAFHVAQELGSQVWEVDRAGRVLRTCSWTAPAPPAQAPSQAFYDTTGIVGDGAGGVYVELENDQNIVRLDRNCRLLGTYVHATFAEANAENENLACDTVTFPIPAIWIRDSDGHGTAVAYGMPDGYCPAPTRLVARAAPQMPVGVPAPVCAELSLRGRGMGVAGRPVTLFVDRVPVAAAATDVAGRLCATVSPTAGPHLAQAVYLGSRGFLPAAGAATFVGVIGPPTPAVAPPPPAAPPAVFVPVLNPPLPGARPPGPPVQAVAQPQPNPQAQSQPQIGSALSGVKEEQHEVALADQHRGDEGEQLAMSARGSARGPTQTADSWLVAEGLAAAALLTATAVVVRRRQHQPYGQRSH
jgi:hypothetical protein